MFHHRFSTLLSEEQPRSVAATSVTAAFVVCPLAWRPTTVEECLVRQHLFERAYREALAVVRPSRLERLQAFALN